MPKRKQAAQTAAELEKAAAPARSMWTGTITFGLVSIPVELLSAVRPRQTAMKLVDKAGHPLGRQYHCSKEEKKLNFDDLVRGYETDDGEMVVITDEEFESVAPEMSGDIDLRNFVPIEQIPPIYFQRPYLLAPAGKSTKAYHLLAITMERTGRVGIGSFVMRGHEYLVAIISDNGVLRADTLRYADEIRTPRTLGLPERKKVAASKVNRFAKAIDDLSRNSIDVSELEDKEAAVLQELAEKKQSERSDVVHTRGLESEDPEAAAGGAQIIDIMEVLRRSLSRNAVVRTAAERSEPISLAERRAARDAGSAASSTKKSSPKRRSESRSKATSRRRRTS